MVVLKLPKPLFSLPKWPVSCKRKSTSKTTQFNQLRPLLELTKMQTCCIPSTLSRQILFKNSWLKWIFYVKDMVTLNNSKVFLRSRGIKRSKANSKLPKPPLTKTLLNLNKAEIISPLEGKWFWKQTGPVILRWEATWTRCCSRKRISTSTSQNQGEREGDWPEAQDQSHWPAAKQQTIKTSRKKEGEGFMRKAMALNLPSYFFFYLSTRFLQETYVRFNKAKKAGALRKRSLLYVHTPASFACHL